jgi:hypothetical protein
VLEFESVNEYFEDFMARIDAPLLDHLAITFKFDYFYFDRALILDAQQLLRFIVRTPKLQVAVEAHIGFDDPKVRIEFSSPTPASSNVLALGILCIPLDPQLSCLAQLCRSPLPTLEDHYISPGLSSATTSSRTSARRYQYHRMARTFSTIDLSEESLPFPGMCACSAKLVEERMTGVLPTVENVFLESFRPSEPVHEAIGQFIAARQLSSGPIAIPCQDRTCQSQNRMSMISEYLSPETLILEISEI